MDTSQAIYFWGVSILPAAVGLIQERVKITQSLKENLAKVQQRMKFFADKHRTEWSFIVGDMVFFKLQPYRQQSISLRRNFTLAAKYYGLFEVLEKVGSVAYRLKLQEGARLHPVFHVSLFKKKIGPTHTITSILPKYDSQDHCLLVLEQILSRRVMLMQSQPII